MLAAGTDKEGPGPLVSTLAGKSAGTFPIPITIVPGNLDDAALASPGLMLGRGTPKSTGIFEPSSRHERRIRCSSRPKPRPIRRSLKFLPGRDGARHRHRRVSATPSEAEELAARRAAVRRRRRRRRLPRRRFRHRDQDRTASGRTSSRPMLGAIMEHFMSGMPVLARRAGGDRRRRVLLRGRRRDRRRRSRS